MIVEFSTEVETWQEEGPDQDYLNGEPYSFRGATNGRITNVTAAVSARTCQEYCGESLVKEISGVTVGDTLYVVVAGYTSGDTFGRDGGHTAVLDAFTDPKRAEELRDIAGANRDEYQLTVGDAQYYCPWVGYFEHLEEMHVWEVTVRERHQYHRFENGVDMGFKRGR